MRIRTLIGCGVLGAWMCIASPAVAQEAAAEALFVEAKELVQQGDYLSACPKFKASYELDKQLGTLLNLADCLERASKFSSAWARWKEAIEWAKRERDNRLGFAEKRLAGVAPRISKLTVNVQNPVAGLVVKRGDVVIKPATYGLALPVDAGAVKVSVLRGERVLETRSTQVGEASSGSINLDLGAINKKHPPKKGERRVVGGGAEPEPYDPTQATAGLAIGAAGLAAVLIAGGLEIGALVKKGDANEADSCINKFCTPEGLEAAEGAATLAEAGQWVGIAGLATLAIGTTIYLTSPDPPEDDDVARRRPKAPPKTGVKWVRPWSAPGGFGITVGGAL